VDPQQKSTTTTLAEALTMNWKQTLFLGGAILLLAACSDATAPSTQLRRGSAGVAAKGTFNPTVTSETCKSGYSIQPGADSTTACGLY
jgi:hypothetical protein